MGAFQSGYNSGLVSAQQALENRRRAKLDARQEEMDRRADQEHARRVSQQGAEDDAFRSYSTLNKDGVVSGATGLSQPSMQMLYGGGTAYGSGPEAVQGAAGDYSREMNRMAAAAPERAAGLPVYNPTAPITTRPATELEQERAFGAIAAARRDVGQMRVSQANAKKINLDDGRKAEFARLNKLSPGDLAETLGGEFSRDGSGVDAMLTYDEKTNKYLFASKVPGLPSQTLSKPELMKYALGLWEAGNGDLTAGMQAQIDGITTQRSLREKDAARAAALASGNADLFFKGQTANNDRTRTGALSRYYDAQIERSKRETEASNWGTEQYVDKDGNIRVYDVNRKGKTPDFRERVMPPGLKPYNPKPAPEVMKMGEFVDTFGEQVVSQTDGSKTKLRDLPPAKVREEYIKFIGDGAGAGGSKLDARGVAAASNPGGPGRGGLQLPLRQPTMDQFYAMSPEAVRMYADAGDPVAKALLRQMAERQGGPEERADPNIDRGY